MFFVALATLPIWTLLLVAVSILSMTYGNIVAIAQKNMKRLLAYSGIAQIGNVLIGLATGTKMGSDAMLFYLVTYLFANLGAFAIVIAVSEAIGSEEIDDYSGLGRRSPFLAFSMLIFLLSLAGVPPLAGFIGKLYIFVAAIKEGLYVLITVGLINIVISMYYYLIVVKKMYVNEPHDRSPLKVSGPIKVVVYVCLAGTLAIGVYPQPVTDWVVSAIMIFSNVADPTALPSHSPCGHSLRRLSLRENGSSAPSKYSSEIFLAGSSGGGYSFQDIGLHTHARACLKHGIRHTRTFDYARTRSFRACFPQQPSTDHQDRVAHGAVRPLVDRAPSPCRVWARLCPHCNHQRHLLSQHFRLDRE